MLLIEHAKPGFGLRLLELLKHLSEMWVAQNGNARPSQHQIVNRRRTVRNHEIIDNAFAAIAVRIEPFGIPNGESRCEPRRRRVSLWNDDVDVVGLRQFPQEVDM